MKLYILSLVLLFSSCSITRYYKTKDIRKNFSKYEQNMNKSIYSLQKDLNYQKRIISEITVYKLDKKIEKKLRGDLKYCKSIKKDVEQERKIYRLRYKNLDLSGKKITSKEKRYKDIEKIRDFVTEQGEELKEKFENYKERREVFYKRLSDNNFKLVKTKDVKKQFDSFNARFKGQYHKAKSSIEKFKGQVLKSRSKKKSKLLNELKTLNVILAKIEVSNQKVDKVVTKFHADHGGVAEMIFGPNSPTYMALEVVKQEMAQLNIRVSEFNSQAHKIKKIAEE